MALKLIRKFAVASLLTLLSSATVSAQTLVFTAIPDEDETKLVERFTGIADYLAGELDVDVRYIPVKSYAAAVSAFRNNQVQLAWFGGLSGVRARALVPGSRAIAQGKGDLAFVTYFIAHASTGIAESKTFPKAIAGKTFTFGSKGSTSGRLMPEYHVRRIFGAAPDKVFSRVGFSGDHSRTIALVQSGAYQAGAVNFKVWENELKAGKIDLKKVSVIWKTPPYPDYQWTIRGDLNRVFGAQFAKRVKAALLALRDPDVLASFPRKRFVTATNADYRPILEIGKSIGLID